MRASLVLTVKDEAPYLLEWVAHHRAIGFTDIFIFQNDSTDRTDAILKILSDIGAVSYRYNKAIAPGRHQVRAYRRAARQPGFKTADWAMALDVDEFLHVKCGNGRLEDLAGTANGADQILINWKRFGSGGQTKIAHGLVTERFVVCEPAGRIAHELQAFKSFFRPDRFERAGVHQARGFQREGAPIAINGSGLSKDAFAQKNFRSTDPGLLANAQINHYVVRDAASFLLKTIRGSAHQSNRILDQRYWRKHNVSGEVDSDLANLSDRTRAEMAVLDTASGGRLSRHTRLAVREARQRFLAALKDDQARELYRYCVRNSGMVVAD